MNRIEHYHDWLRDAHAMEKQAESMLESMASRIDNYPELRARIEQHLSETKWLRLGSQSVVYSLLMK